MPATAESFPTRRGTLQIPKDVQSILATGAVRAAQQVCARAMEDIVLQPGPPGEQGPVGEKGMDGILSRVDPWTPEKRLHAKNVVVSHLSGLWQATRSTDAEPGTDGDWKCLVRGVQQVEIDGDGNIQFRMSDGELSSQSNIRGPEGRGWEHKGTYRPTEWYTRSDVVVLRGSGYVAIQDSPGECPGPGWRMFAQAQKGPSGKPGRDGRKGEFGPPGPRGEPGDSLLWRGQYTTESNYARNDIVSFSGGVWICLEPTSQPPKADGVNWEPMIRNPHSRGGGGNVASASGSLTIVELTQAEYDFLSPPDPRSLYLICG